MKKYLIIYALLSTAILVVGGKHLLSENQRLKSNQEAFSKSVEHYRTRWGQEVTSVQVLQLKIRELKSLRQADAREIQRLGIRLRRTESIAKAKTHSQIAFSAPLSDRAGQEAARRSYSEEFADGFSKGNIAENASDSGAEDSPHATSGIAHKESPFFTPQIPHQEPLIDPNNAPQINRFTPIEKHFTWCDPWVKVRGVICRDSIHCEIHSTDTLTQIVHRVPRRFLFFRWGTKAIRQEITSSNPHTRIVYSEYIRLKR